MVGTDWLDENSPIIKNNFVSYRDIGGKKEAFILVMCRKIDSVASKRIDIPLRPVLLYDKTSVLYSISAAH